jgi:hypothetical protein
MPRIRVPCLVTSVSNLQHHRRSVQLLIHEPSREPCAQISRHDALGDIVQYAARAWVCHRIVRENVSRQQWEVLPRCEYKPTQGLSHRLYAKQGDETKRINL